MNARKGEFYHCPQCGLDIEIIHGGDWPPLQQSDHLQCSCGEKLILLQSGSESVQGSKHGQNKIMDPVQR